MVPKLPRDRTWGRPDECPKELRAQWARACRERKLRRVGDEWPCSWHPYEVVSPASGELELSFTDSSAWEWIAEQLELLTPLASVDMESPPDATAYAFEVFHAKVGRHIYVKLQTAAGGKVIARSFHYSEKD